LGLAHPWEFVGCIFAQQRRAFGAAIGRYPLVLEALAERESDLYRFEIGPSACL